MLISSAIWKHCFLFLAAEHSCHQIFFCVSPFSLSCNITFFFCCCFFLSINQRVPSGSLAALECTLIFSNFPRRAPQILWSEPQLADEKEQSYLPYMSILSAAAPFPSNCNNTAPIGLQNTMEVYVDKVKKKKEKRKKEKKTHSARSVVLAYTACNGNDSLHAHLMHK